MQFVRTNWDHRGKVIALSTCSREENFDNQCVYTLLFGQERRQAAERLVGNFCFQPRWIDRDQIDPLLPETTKGTSQNT